MLSALMRSLCERHPLCRHHQRLLPEFTSAGPECSCGGFDGLRGDTHRLSLSLWGWGVEGAFGGSASSPAAACQVLTQRQADEGMDAKRKASFLHAVSRLKSGVFLRFWVICNHLPPEFSWTAGHKGKPGDKTQ